MLAITSGGAIPDNADYRVVLEPENTFIGTVNEDFAVESLQGDIFQLGNTSWRFSGCSRAWSGWRMRTASRRAFRSGWARRRRGATSCRPRCRS